MALATSSITTWNNDGTGTWTDVGGGGGSGTNNDVFLTSTGSRARKVSNGIKGFLYQVNAGGQDLSAQVLCIRWATLAGVGSLDTRTNGGVAITVQDTSGNISYWDIDGADTYGGGWKVSLADMSTSPSRNNGTNATLTAVQYVGIVWDETASVGGGDPNCYIDEILSWPITGITITGDSTAFVDDLVDTLDSSQGIWERRGGIVFSKARIILTPGASDFTETGRILVFENPVYDAGSTIDSSLSEIGIESAASNTITFTRCSLLSADPDETVTTDSNREFDFASATDANFNTCTISGFNGSTMALGGSGNSYDDCTFSLCAEITDTGAVVRRGFVRDTQAAATEAALLWTSSSDWEDTEFVMGSSNSHAIEIETNSLTDTWTGFVFTGYSTSAGPTSVGNEVLINNSTTGTVTITTVSITDTVSFRNNGGGLTTIVANVSITITGLKNPTEVRVYLTGTRIVVDGQEDVTTGTFGFTAGSGVGLDIRIFALGYYPADLINYSTTSNATFPVAQVLDRNYLNP